MEIGVDSFVAATVDGSGRAVDPARRLSELLEAITFADKVGLDVFGIGEHHRREFLDSAPTVILAAAAVPRSPPTLDSPPPRGSNPPYTTNERRHRPERGRSGARVPGVRDA